MSHQLSEIHQNMLAILSDAQQLSKNMGKIEGARTQLTELVSKAQDIYDKKVFNSVNRLDFSKSVIAKISENTQAVIAHEDRMRTIGAKHGLSESVNRFFNHIGITVSQPFTPNTGAGTDIMLDLLEPKGESKNIGAEKGKVTSNGCSVFVNDCGSTRYVFSKDGQAISALQIVSKDGKTGTIASVITHKDHQNQGHASRLFNTASKDFDHIKHNDDLTKAGAAFANSTQRPQRYGEKSNQVHDLKHSVNKRFSEIRIERTFRHVAKTFKPLVNQYKTAVFDYNRAGGTGFYDYMGQYSLSNKVQHSEMVEGIKALKTRGFDIEMLQMSNDNNVVILLTNSGNVDALHDILYQKCQGKFSVNGRFISPKWDNPVDVNVLREQYSRSSAMMLSHCSTSNKVPILLEPHVNASVDGYGITTGKPQFSLLTSLIPKRHTGVKNSIHCTSSEQPLNMAKKARNAIIEREPTIEQAETQHRTTARPRPS
jgi:hypothetical protein